MPDIAGLKLIVPTSATATGAGSSATVSASGKVTFTTVETLTIADCFSASYDNYLFVIRHAGSVSGAVSIRAQWVVSGSPATGSNYTVQNIEASSGTITSARDTSQTSAKVGATNDSLRSGDHLYIYGPYLAQPTTTRTLNVSANASAYILDFASTHSLSTSYTGVKLFPNSGNMTGALTIYGLSQ